MNSKQVLQPEFSYGGIDAVIEKEFITKLIGLSNLKGKTLQDLEKAIWYITREINRRSK